MLHDSLIRGAAAFIGQQGFPGWWGVMPTEHGLLYPKTSGGGEPPLGFRELATRLCQRLNKEIARDGLDGRKGHWAVIWTDFIAGDLDPVAMRVQMKPRLLCMVFMDRHGDVQFVVDNDQAFIIQALPQTQDDFIEQCDEAWHRWREQMKDVGVNADQTQMAAAGQKSVDENDAPEIIPFH